MWSFTPKLKNDPLICFPIFPGKRIILNFIKNYKNGFRIREIFIANKLSTICLFFPSKELIAFRVYTIKTVR